MKMEKTPIKAIRAKCLDCCCGSAKEVALCPIPDCSLYPYRFGKNPKLKGRTNKGSFPQKSTAQTADFEHVTVRDGNYTASTEKTADGCADA